MQINVEQLFSSSFIVDWSYTESAQSVSYSQFQEWTFAGSHGPLAYLADHRSEMRENLKHIFPGFKGAFVFLFSYAHFKWAFEKMLERWQRPSSLKMASYGLVYEGKDYHHIIKELLKIIAEELRKKVPGHHHFEYQLGIDTLPILERDLAYRSGLGWFGKNSMLIHPKHGSYTFIAPLLVNYAFSPAELKNCFPLPSSVLSSALPVITQKDHCGTCTACISACPTQAIDEKTRTLNASQCLSTFTIELFKDADPPTGHENHHGEFFGCEICQEVCPWNERLFRQWNKNLSGEESWEYYAQNLAEDSRLKKILQFFYEREVSQVILDLEQISNREFRRMFQGTVLERTGRAGILKNFKRMHNKK